MKIKTGLGQDSHKFDKRNSTKKLLLGNVLFEGHPSLKGNSDADVVLHSLTNAISGITGKNILGKIADQMCLEQGITDSRVYLKEACKYLAPYKISSVSISIECLTPKISDKIDQMKKSIADLLNISFEDIGITATSGEGLSDFGKGLGIQVLSIITATSN